MLKFKDIELTDKQWAEELLQKSGFNSCEYSFTTNFIWKNVFNLKICRFKDYYIVRSGIEGNYRFVFPAGDGDISELIEELREYCIDANQKLNLVCVNPYAKALLEREFPGEFEFRLNRNDFDYIYSSEDLIYLKGKKYHSKRNFISQFKVQYENRFSYEPINKDNINDCIEMNYEWCRLNNCAEDKSKINENHALLTALDNFSVLPVNGGLIRIDGQVSAFSIGEHLTDNTYHIMFEKALSNIKGLYQVINQKFAEANCSEYAFINREEDVGSEGLRKSKLSYKPVMLLEKWTAFEI